MSISLPVHIVAGALGILTGFIALSVAKGGRLHRTSGTVFVYAMLVMTLLGGMLAILHNKAPQGNVPVALLTAYLVITALTTVKPLPAGARRVDAGLMVLISMVTVAFFTLGFVAIANPALVQRFPPAPFFIFGTLALLASVGDFRLIRAGGVQTIRGAPRVARHLWRMCTALLIAAFSFFIGQARVIPKPYRIYPLLVIPPLVVLVAVLYWMWRVRGKRAVRGMVVRERSGVRAGGDLDEADVPLSPSAQWVSAYTK